jgi:hypothetical protein
MRFSGQHREFKGKLQIILSGLLLTLYCLGTMPSALIHDIFHEHHEVTHSASDEADPCHRTIYHQDADKGCRHESHFMSSEQCKFSDSVLPIDQSIADAFSFEYRYLSSKTYTDLYFEQVLSTQEFHSSRAPPVV